MYKRVVQTGGSSALHVMDTGDMLLHVSIQHEFLRFVIVWQDVQPQLSQT
jgi:hypothetical protein